MPTSLLTRIRGSRAGSPATPREYVLLTVAAALLVAMVFLALGQLVDDQRNCANRAQTTASATRC
ncbi:hypothetical protein [Sporichthya sp.]|uniref:hypothetical protein n=1 Tax=Sporichthya sp. TaxID=65475 RepID=UPI0018498BBB|nr:hypothetical protein [Sporichthya sp.]MBA3745492.1 hypothetical protein [Sporichthya sp.]